MKKLIGLACLALAPVMSMAAELYVCTGAVGTDTVTLVDTGYQVWVVKGTFDIKEGPGSLPKYLFRQQAIQPNKISETECTLVAEGTNSLTLKNDCATTETNAAATLSVNIPSLALTATDAPVICNIVDPEAQPEPEQAEEETAH